VIDSVKTMWLTVPGESHSGRISCRVGITEVIDSTYAVNVTEVNSGSIHNIRIFVPVEQPGEM
jgi:hypothetical protein